VVADLRTFVRPLAVAPPAMHVLGTSWQNDRALTLDRLLTDGLQVLFDAEPDAQTVNASTFAVSADIPDNDEVLSTTVRFTGLGQYLRTDFWSGSSAMRRMPDSTYTDGRAGVRSQQPDPHPRDAAGQQAILATPATDAERMQPRRLDGQALGMLAQREDGGSSLG